MGSSLPAPQLPSPAQLYLWNINSDSALYIVGVTIMKQFIMMPPSLQAEGNFMKHYQLPTTIINLWVDSISVAGHRDKV